MTTRDEDIAALLAWCDELKADPAVKFVKTPAGMFTMLAEAAVELARMKGPHEKGCAWIDEEYGEADVCLTCGDDTTWPCRPYLMQWNAELLATVKRVRDLADAWTSRGEHQLAFSKTAPEDVIDALVDSGADWVEKARILRLALDASPSLPMPTPTPEPERRLRACVEAWPNCATGEYNPACCRFPKSCSCTVYSAAHVTDEDLE